MLELNGEWHLDERRFVEQRYLGAAEALAGLRLDAGEVAEALALGERVCHEVLGRELGRRPAGETRRLYRELRGGAGPS